VSAPDRPSAPVSAPDPSSADRRPGAFLITIDTEGDDLWSRPHDITTRNADALPRFQELCEAHGLKPTYLVNWEMAISPAFVALARDALARDVAEVGMHLHAWNSPPLVALTNDDFEHRPYLYEYPEPLMRQKIEVMTRTLEDTFGMPMVSHRAGRWGLDRAYVRALIDAGYGIDCSVTPHVDWRPHLGHPAGHGGPDFRAFPDRAYLMDPDDPSRPGSSNLLQVPMTIISRHAAPWTESLRGTLRRVPLVGRPLAATLPRYTWLRPDGRNGPRLRSLLSLARDQRRDHVEFMLHSSELMAGGSPTFRTPESIEALYGDLEALFDAARGAWRGMTLREYRDALASAAVTAPGAQPS
jgi:hypothetical protein